MKIFGLSVLFCACLCVGVYKSLSLKLRMKQLRNLLDCFSQILSELEYSKISAADIFEIFKSYENVPILCEIAEDKINISPEEKYVSSWNKCCIKMYINESDRSILDRFFYAFGKNGRDEQIRLLNITVDELGKAYTDSTEKFNKYSRLYALSGFMVGLFFVIVLA